MILLGELEEFIERRLPFDLQESWDKSGIWFRNSKMVTKIGVALELKDLVGYEIDTAIIHHPPALTSEEAVNNRQVVKAASDINLIVCHTNADNARNSFVDDISRRIGLENLKPLVPGKLERLKVVTFVDKGSRDDFINTIDERGFSMIGFYDACTFSTPGTGTYKPADKARPYADVSPGKLAQEPEWRIEFEVPARDLDRAVETIFDAHPYEEPVVEIYRFYRYPRGTGTGRIGLFSGNLKELYSRLKDEFNSVQMLNLACDEASPVCIIPGGGRKLLRAAADKGVKTFISGDIDYHTLQYARSKNINIISIEHREAELGFTGWMKNILEEYFRDKIEIITAGE